MKQLILLFILLVHTLFVHAASITAQADRNPIHVNESFNLTFEAEGSVDDEPDFSPLKNNFTIINQSQGSSISIINGSYSKTTRWTLLLMPKAERVFTIPSIAFGKDRSPQLRMTIKPQQTSTSGQSSDLFMELETSTQNTWVQSQIILTVRLLSATNISQFGISKLKTNNMDVVIEQLGEDKRYQTSRGNTPYLVFERRFALFPQQAGTLRIEPFLGEVEVVSGSSNLFDPFSRKTKIKRARSKPTEITIAGIPAEFKGKVWLPAKELKLVEEWSEDPAKFKAGEPITRTLSVFANGLTSAQLPEMSLPSVNGLKQYPDQPLLKDNQQDDGIIGARQEKIAVIPSQSGSFTLPAIEIPWWNTTTGKMEVATIDSRTITVASGSQLNQPVTSVTSQDLPVTSVPQQTASPNNTGLWFWLSLFLASGWLITVILWWLSRVKRKTSEPGTIITDTPSHKQVLASLKKACHKHDAPACRQALMQWGNLVFETKPRNLSELAIAAGEPLASQINALNSALYSATPEHWSADEIWQTVQQLQTKLSAANAHDKYSLEPLYK